MANTQRMVINISFLTEHYKGKYRIKAPYDLFTNDFPRKLNGTLEDIDCYIDCQYGNKIFYYGRSTLQAYIPSLVRGHNILKQIKENFGNDIAFDIEETDSEVLFLFKSKDDSKIIPLLKPKTLGSSISPFSTKNLPKSDYKIPDDQLDTYKDLTSKLGEKAMVFLKDISCLFLQQIASKSNPIEKIRLDMRMKGLKSKEYIHSIGKWDEYMKFISKKIEEKK